MRNLKKKLALPLVGAVLSVGSIQMANAGALASSVVTFENFKISEATNVIATPQGNVGTIGNQINAEAFDLLTYNSTADVGATLGGLSNNPPAQNSTNGAPLDMFASVGAHTYADNSFIPLSSAGGEPSGNYAIGDQNEQGSPVLGLAPGVGSPANLGNASYVALKGSGTGSATSNNGLTARVSFSGYEGNLAFSFDISAFLEVFLEAGDAAPSFAQASYSISMKLVSRTGADGGATLLNFSLVCDDSHSAPGLGVPFHGAGNCGLIGVQQAQHFDLFSGPLLKASTYELTARIDTAADARFVPAPGVIGLMGIGLLGLYGASRRRRFK